MNEAKVYQAHYQTATDVRIVQTRKAIRSALLSLLDQNEFDSITIPELARAAGIGYTTFYRHYPGKAELLEEIATAEVHKLIETSFPAFERTDTHSAAMILCCHVAEHRALWKTLLTGGAASKMREIFIQRSMKIAGDYHSPLDWLPADLGTAHMASSLMEMLGWWLRQVDPIPVEQLATILERVVIQPVSKNLVPAG